VATGEGDEASEAGPRLFCFGFGFSAAALARRLRGKGWRTAGTCRGEDKRRRLEAAGIEAHLFDRGRPLAEPAQALAGTTALLISAPPDRLGDPVLDHHAENIAALRSAWIGYLSTTGVYGDTGGAMVDETAPLAPTSERSRRRVAAEAAWLAFGRDHGLAVHLFRLAGIYGPGRSVFAQVRAGQARRIDRPGHLFSRIHVDDIARILEASLARPSAGAVYNVCDDEPAAQADVIAHACELLGLSVPPLVAFEEARKGMSPMALSFWADNRRVDKARIKRELWVRLVCPDYRAGLRAVLAAEEDPGGTGDLGAGLSLHR
jgi:nucleoside-diphosphate-sugar epimerase